MVLQLISATPSPYARKVRIQLLEKGIDFELKNEVPWDNTTATPEHNPLEKLPILIFDDGRDPIFESHFMLEYIEQKFEPKGSLTPADIDTALDAKKVEVIVDGVCDARVLSFFESERGDKKSEAWLSRQDRKIEGGLKALAGYVDRRKGDFIFGQLSIADIAVGTLVDFLRLTEHPALKQYSNLAAYADKLNERKSFEDTKPYMFDIKDKIV